MDFHSLHVKWQARWNEAHIFEPHVSKGDKFYLTAAFPYPNSPQHIGHARTYTTTDIYARYMRMNGKNVLFPMAFHVTGTPILAMAKRIQAGDPELFGIFDKIYGIPPETTRTLTEPKSLVLFFSKEIEAGMKEMGYSIDWRRKFYTFDAIFNKFIQWQFHKLHEAGLIAKGSHPVPWCPADQQPVGGHDTQGDLDPQLEEVTAVLFQAGEGFIPTITYRPETLPGVTNLWVNPNAKYVLVQMKEAAEEEKMGKKEANAGKKEKKAGKKEAPAAQKPKRIYLTREAFETLSHQFELAKIKDVPASELLALRASHPADGRAIPVLPASFVDPAVGTGLVMSVPAHAPFDWLALRDLHKLDETKPIQVLDTPGFGPCPAGELCQKMGVKNQDDPKAQEATKLLYKTEAHSGRMKSAPYAGLNGIEAKERIKADLVRAGQALSVHILANAPVHCRCGALCVVKQVKNQWFIDYGNEAWKAKTREALAAMRIRPAGLRQDYEYTVGWLQRKACTRASGLGTQFPFDETQMIEALSDSTIYMAFYTIAPIVKKMAADGGIEKIDDQFFDFVLLGKEPADKKKKTPDWDEARREFLYWYPLDSRHSAHDLVHNHLTFMIFIHTAVFAQAQEGADGKKRPASSFWPRQAVSNGFVTMEGKKMSKSMGNILPLRKAIAQYGTDVVRFVVTSSAELEADSDFNQAAAEGVISRLNVLENYLKKTINEKTKAPSRSRISRWFYSRFHSRVRDARAQYDEFQLRPLAKALLYDTVNDLQWYSRRSARLDLREFFEYWALLANPFMPHVAEEFWEMLGEKKAYAAACPMAVSAGFPSADTKQIDPSLEMGEQYLQSVIEDVRHILSLIKNEKPASISLIVHSSWKKKARALVAAHKNIKAVMDAAKKDPELSKRAQAVAQLAGKLIKNIGSITGEALDAQEEMDVLTDAREFLSSEFLGAKIEVLREEDAPPALAAKASNALPGKPSIFVSP